jgi:hypothetical protein
MTEGREIDQIMQTNNTPTAFKLNNETILTAAAGSSSDTAYSRSSWLLDSGANAYICSERSWFSEIHEFNQTVYTADNKSPLRSTEEEQSRLYSSTATKLPSYSS